MVICSKLGKKLSVLFDDAYTVITQHGEALLKEKGSKFYAVAFPVFNENDIKQCLEKLKSKYPDASHHCYAWVLHPDKSAQRANDDGEPANTAGKPILRQILTKELTNTLVVVVRYFGGTLLGVGGLIAAYGLAAKMVLDEATTEKRIIEGVFEVTYEYENEGNVFLFIKTLGAQITSINKQEKVTIHFAVRKSNVERVHQVWSDFRNFELKFVGYK